MDEYSTVDADDVAGAEWFQPGATRVLSFEAKFPISHSLIGLEENFTNLTRSLMSFISPKTPGSVMSPPACKAAMA